MVATRDALGGLLPYSRATEAPNDDVVNGEVFYFIIKARVLSHSDFLQ